MIKAESSKFNTEIRNLIKLWDAKIANLRAELNLKGLYRRLSKMAEKEEIEEDL